MSSENGDVYIMSPSGDEEWVSPTPVRTAIADAVADATDLAGDEVGDIEEYVDLPALRAVIDGDEEQLTFSVEDHEVTITDEGDIQVD